MSSSHQRRPAAGPAPMELASASARAIIGVPAVVGLLAAIWARS